MDRVHGIVLSGGSAFGLEATSGVMQYLEERGIGFDVGIGVVPIVCGASLFDLRIGDSTIRPDKAMGYQACCNSEKNCIQEGNYGVGTGASVGKYRGMDRAMKSGLGIYCIELKNLKVGAIVGVNAIGNVIDNETNRFLAGLLNEEKNKIISTKEEMWKNLDINYNTLKNTNTTIGCIVTNAKLTKAQATKIASMAHNGYARAISPVHTSLDGDTIFALGTGKIETNTDILGTLAAYVMEKAIHKAVTQAQSAYGLKSYRDLNDTKVI